MGVEEAGGRHRGSGRLGLEIRRLAGADHRNDASGALETGRNPHARGIERASSQRLARSLFRCSDVEDWGNGMLGLTFRSRSQLFLRGFEVAGPNPPDLWLFAHQSTRQGGLPQGRCK